MIERMHACRSVVLAAFVALAGSLCTTSLAQSTSIGPEVRRVAQLSGDQSSLLQQFVRENSGNLSSENPDLIRRNRAALLEPLADSQASPAFRLKYSELLIPVISPLASSKTDIIVINALVIAGDLATAQSTDLLKAAASSEKPAVRYQSAYGMRRTFESLANMPTLTMRPDQAEDLVKVLTGRLSIERDPLVLDGLVHAGIESAKVSVLRNGSLVNVTNAVGALAKSHEGVAGSALAPVMLRAGAGVRDILSAATPGQISPDAVKAAAHLGGHLIAFCVRGVESKQIPVVQRGQSEYASRETYAQIATTAENIVLLAATLQGASGVDSRQLGEKLKNGTAGGDASFVEDARTIVGSGGLLAKPPFNFAPGTFIEK